MASLGLPAQTSYSEHTETHSRSFTWLTLAAPRSSYLLSAHMVFFPQARRRLLRKHRESRTRDSSRHVQVNHLESALVTGRNVSSHFRERARESAKTKVTLALRKAHFSAASSQTGYSETSEAVSRGFTWLTWQTGYSEHTETHSRSFTWLTLAAPRACDWTQRLKPPPRTRAEKVQQQKSLSR